MKIRSRVVAGVLLASLLPLAAAAGVSIVLAREVAERSATASTLEVARQVAGRIDAFFVNHERILAALAETVSSSTHLDDRQRRAVLRNYVLGFRSLDGLVLFDLDGRTRVAVRRSLPCDEAAEVALAKRAAAGEVALGDYSLCDDLQPVVNLAVPIRGPRGIEGAVVAELELVELWRLVDEVRVGESGYALVAAADGRILSGGMGPLKAASLLGEALPADAAARRAWAEAAPVTGVGRGGTAEEVLGASVPVRARRIVVSVLLPVSEAFAPARTLAVRLAAVVAAAGLFALLVAWRGARSPLATISALAASIERIARGDFLARAPDRGDDELAALARNLNAMAARLRSLTEEVREHERMSVFSAIAAGLAHDLKHPLKNLENQARLVGELKDDPEFIAAFRRTVEREFATLDRFLGNLHDLTQTPALTPVPLDPAALLRAAAEGVAGQARDRGVRLRVDAPPGLPRLLGDRIVLERALKNLIVNAVEASPRDAEVVLSATVGDEVVLRVRDQGPGIPPERRPRLFEAFSSTKRSGKGLGLGLALTRRFVEEQGGRISVDTEPGRGAEFRLHLPLAPATALSA